MTKAWPRLGRADRTCDVKWSQCSGGAPFARLFPGRHREPPSHGSYAHFPGTMLLALGDISGNGVELTRLTRGTAHGDMARHGGWRFEAPGVFRPFSKSNGLPPMFKSLTTIVFCCPPLSPSPPRHVQIRKRKTQTKEVRSAAREMALREVKSRKKAVKKGGKKR